MCHGPVLSQVLIPIISESNREPMLARHSGWQVQRTGTPGPGPSGEPLKKSTWHRPVTCVVSVTSNQIEWKATALSLTARHSAVGQC